MRGNLQKLATLMFDWGRVGGGGGVEFSVL